MKVGDCLFDSACCEGEAGTTCGFVISNRPRRCTSCGHSNATNNNTLKVTDFMKCPKCGHDNPADTLFCEECDWRLDQRFTGDKKRNPLMFSAVSLILGLVAIVCGLSLQPTVGVCAGIVGMVISGYSVNIPRYIECNKNLCMAMAGIGILLNIIGFLFGLNSM